MENSTQTHDDDSRNTSEDNTRVQDSSKHSSEELPKTYESFINSFDKPATIYLTKDGTDQASQVTTKLVEEIARRNGMKVVKNQTQYYLEPVVGHHIAEPTKPLTPTVPATSGADTQFQLRGVVVTVPESYWSSLHSSVSARVVQPIRSLLEPAKTVSQRTNSVHIFEQKDIPIDPDTTPMVSKSQKGIPLDPNMTPMVSKSQKGKHLDQDLTPIASKSQNGTPLDPNMTPIVSKTQKGIPLDPNMTPIVSKSQKGIRLDPDMTPIVSKTQPTGLDIGHKSGPRRPNNMHVLDQQSMPLDLTPMVGQSKPPDLPKPVVSTEIQHDGNKACPSLGSKSNALVPTRMSATQTIHPAPRSILPAPAQKHAVRLQSHPAPVQPQPVPGQPQPVPVQPQRVPGQSHPVPGQRHPVTVQPQIVPVQSQPVQGQGHPVPVQPQIVPVQSHPVPGQRHPVPVQPQIVPVQSQPVPVQSQPVPVQPQIVPVQSQPVPVQSQPVPVQPHPVPGQPHPVQGQPQPVPGQRHPFPGQPQRVPGPHPAPVQHHPAPVQPLVVPGQHHPAQVQVPVRIPGQEVTCNTVLVNAADGRLYCTNPDIRNTMIDIQPPATVTGRDYIKVRLQEPINGARWVLLPRFDVRKTPSPPLPRKCPEPSRSPSGHARCLTITKDVTLPCTSTTATTTGQLITPGSHKKHYRGCYEGSCICPKKFFSKNNTFYNYFDPNVKFVESQTGIQLGIPCNTITMTPTSSFVGFNLPSVCELPATIKHAAGVPNSTKTSAATVPQPSPSSSSASDAAPCEAASSVGLPVSDSTSKCLTEQQQQPPQQRQQ